jgi:hypothetical protein
MSRRIVAYTTLSLTAALLVAGCSSSADKAAPAAPTVSATTAPAPTATAGKPAAGKPTATKTGTKTGTAPTGQGGGGLQQQLADADFVPEGFADDVKPCPYPEQKPIIVMVRSGDVNGDRVPEMLVVRTCTAFTSYWPSSVEVFDGASPVNTPRRIGTLLEDKAVRLDSPNVYDVRVSKGVVTVVANGVDAKTDNSCPNQTFTYRYQLSGEKFRLLDRKVGPRKSECPRITN